MAFPCDICGAATTEGPMVEGRTDSGTRVKCPKCGQYGIDDDLRNRLRSKPSSLSTDDRSLLSSLTRTANRERDVMVLDRYVWDMLALARKKPRRR